MAKNAKARKKRKQEMVKAEALEKKRIRKTKSKIRKIRMSSPNHKHEEINKRLESWSSLTQEEQQQARDFINKRYPNAADLNEKSLDVLCSYWFYKSRLVKQ